MTNEEAKINLEMIRIAFGVPITKEQREIVDETFKRAMQALSSWEEYSDKLWEKAYERGKTEALSQEPCDDVISRDMALEKMADYVASGYADSAEDFEEYSRIICQLPSVMQKSGKWILTDDDFVYCSECEDSYYPRPIDASWYYCPHCGAKMVEPQESEDKE